MILFPHVLTGALIGSKFENLAAIFILAVFFHYLLDLLPHWDYLEKETGYASQKNLFHFLLKATLELALSLLFVWFLFLKDSLFVWPYILWGIFWSILPDGMVFLNHLTKEKFGYLSIHQKFHDKIHWLFDPNKKAPIWLGAIIEAAIITALIFLILS